MMLISQSTGGTFNERFAKLPTEIRRDPFRKGLPPAEIWMAFLTLPYPARREFWLAEEGGRAIGRIGANLSPSQPGLGLVGFFECDVTRPDVAEALIAAAVHWLREHGASDIYGPVAFNTWFPYRFALPSTDGKLFAWEPVNPPEYPKFFEAAGFIVAETYSSMGLDKLAELRDSTNGSYDRSIAAGYTYRPFDAPHLLDAEVPILHAISHESFRSAFLFEPLPLELFRQLYVPLAKSFEPRLAWFALDPSGKEVGFLFCFADGDSLVMKSVAVLEGAQGHGLSNGLTYLCAKAGLEMGLARYITALVREGIRSESYAKKSVLLWRHEYVLYRY